MHSILSNEGELSRFVEAHRATAVFFSGSDCAVCRSLWPKLASLLAERFPRLRVARVDIDDAPALAGAWSVFAVPLVVVLFDGRETIRKGGAFALAELQGEIARLYAMVFDEAKR